MTTWSNPKTDWAPPNGVADVDMNRIESNIAILALQGGGSVGLTAGTATALTVAAIPALAALTDTALVTVKMHIDCGTSPTLSVNGLAAKPILNSDGTTLVASDLKLGSFYAMRYNNTAGGGTGAFILQGKGGGLSTADRQSLVNEIGGTAVISDNISTLISKLDTVRGSLVTLTNDADTNNSAVKTNVVNKLKAMLPNYFTGLSASSTWTDIQNALVADLDFIAANILQGKNIFGLIGTLIQGKQFASGNTQMSATGLLNVTGLAFLPRVIVAEFTSAVGAGSLPWRKTYRASFNANNNRVLVTYGTPQQTDLQDAWTVATGSFSTTMGAGGSAGNQFCDWEAFE